MKYYIYTHVLQNIVQRKIDSYPDCSFFFIHISIIPSQPFPSCIFLSRFLSPCLYNVALIVEATSLNLVLTTFNNSILCLHRRSESFIALSHNGSCNVYVSIKTSIINIYCVKDSPLIHRAYRYRQVAESTDQPFQY